MASFTPQPSIFFGDYINIASHERRIYPIWMRMDGTNLSVWTAPFTDPEIVSVATDAKVATGFSLSQNYPNPFNASTRIRFTLPTRSGVRLTIHDCLGREVSRPADGDLEAGTHTAIFYADDFPSGVYYYRMSANSFQDTKRVILIK